jgi:glyoxylase-like metal-dependent hydrolase (beta-lactamase superfamily II)
MCHTGRVVVEDRRIGPVTVLFGERGGKYPHGNTLLVEGREESLLVDPSLGLLPRRSRLPRADRVLNSHCHEDHVAGNHLYPDVPWHLHEADLPGIRSLDAMMEIYGYPGPVGAAFRKALVEDFHYLPREGDGARAFREGDRFDLGGVRLEVLHTPGHTRGHSCFRIAWDGGAEAGDLLYLGDIDLSSFGPYYGDAWSSLEDFERSLARVRGIDARWYATFHHVGVLDGRAAFLERLDRFEAVIARREERLLAFLADPRDLDEIARHRFVYRPQDPVPLAEPVERRHMEQHLARLLREGRVEEPEPGRYRAR